MSFMTHSPDTIAQAFPFLKKNPRLIQEQAARNVSIRLEPAVIFGSSGKVIKTCS